MQKRVTVYRIILKTLENNFTTFVIFLNIMTYIIKIKVT